MKFSHKLSVGIIALLGVVFTLGGTALLFRVFKTSLDDTMRQSTNQHFMQKYALEAGMLAEQKNISTANNSYLPWQSGQLDGYISSDQMAALYNTSGEQVYSSLPANLPQEYTADAMNTANHGCVIRKTENGSVYMLIASTAGNYPATVTILSVFDISPLYTQRTENVRFFLMLELFLLLISAIAVFVFSTLLTRPVGQLNSAAQSIAAGSYSKRAPVTGTDEIAQLAQSFNTMAQAVEEKIDAMQLSIKQRDDFVSAFTHEIKTPMTTLIGYAGILRTRQCTPEVQQRAASAIMSEAKRLEDLSQRLLELMGLSGKAPAMVPCSLQGLVKNCVQTMPQNIRQLVEISLPEYPVYVTAEPGLFATLLRNLLLNAFAASTGGSTVLLRATPEHGNCLVQVKDTGCGIPKQDLARITEAFYMADKARAAENSGTGLGLAIAEKIAAIHGTSLVFESQEGKGTTVTFRLTISPAPQTEGEA